MTARDENWKKHLLRTSVPLEHEVAKLLTAQGVPVAGAFPYFRSDEGVEKEFSVDVRGVFTTGGLAHAGRQCVLDVLVECKYRDPGAKWLFLPNPYGEDSFLYSPLQCVDAFSPRYVHGATWDSNAALRVCYSAVEVFGGEETQANAKGGARE